LIGTRKMPSTKYILSLMKGVAQLTRHAACGHEIHHSPRAAQHVTPCIHGILCLVRVNPEDVIGKLAGLAVDVGRVERDGIQYNEGAVDKEEKLRKIIVRE
jgi:hypothetical protein